MIRWRFVLTRLIVIIAVLMLLRWGLGPVAQYVTIRGLESVTGAKVEIANTRVGLFPPRIQYAGFQVADPRDEKAMRDAFRAQSIDLVIDGDALLHRRWVARDGRITGIQIGAQRESSGHIARLDEQSETSDGPSMLSRLVGAASNQLTSQAEEAVLDLETVKRGKAIRIKWEREYEGLVERARNLEKQIRTVRNQVRSIDNPLRDLPELERTLAHAQSARAQLASVRQDIDSLPGRLQADLAQLDEAKQIDLEKVDQYVPGDLTSAGDFGVDMMAEAVRSQIEQIRSYLDGGRTLANYTIVAPESTRIRGVDHDLDRLDRPGVLVRRCEVAGFMRADGQQYEMTGILENLTPTPESLAEPTRARLRLEGPEVVRVEYVRDRRGNADVDLLTLHWPQTDAKPLRLGDEDDASIAINGGLRELWVPVRTEGDPLEGRLVSKQTGVEMDLRTDPQFDSSAAVKSLRESLATVDRIEMDASFTGTWKDLDLNLNTNLGQVLRRASRDAIRQQVRASQDRLAAKVEKTHLDQTRELQQWLGSRQSEARSLLASADKSIEEMSQKVLAEVGSADAYLGKLRGAIRGKLR
ncbi:MAG: TIGR03545 family protein [Rubripirellula sp.]